MTLGKTLLSGLVVALLVPGWLQAQSQAEQVTADQKLLQNHGLKTDGPELLDYFRKRTFKEANPKDIDRLIKELGDDEFQTREKAQAELLKLGDSALVGVKVAAEGAKDVEIRTRAADLRTRIEAKAEPSVQAATARLVGVTKPAGAAGVLLAYLPFAADLNVVDDICKSLGAVTMVNNKVEQAVLDSLSDKLAVKRGAAAEALVRSAAKDHLPAVRKLLKDPEPVVRLHVGLAMLPMKEKEILPVLVDLLADLGPEQLWPVEEALVRLAGTDTPAVSLGSNEATRKQCRDAWSAWLTKNMDKVDMAKIDQIQAMLGYTLLVQQNVNRIVMGKRMPAVGEVLELDAQKKPRWKFEVTTYPVDAQVVRQDRVLVAEYQGGKVSERDFQGNVKWEQAVGGNPIGVQGMQNDNVFVVMQNRLVEYNREHKEVFSMQRATHDIFRARKLRNGEVIFVTNAGQLTRIDGTTQKVLKQFHVGNIPVLFGSIDILPDGGVLIPDFQQNRVIEFAADGTQRKTFSVQWPNSVQRLPNGNTLVASQNTRRVVEFDREGREVAGTNHVTEGMVFNARRR